MLWTWIWFSGGLERLIDARLIHVQGREAEDDAADDRHADGRRGDVNFSVTSWNLFNGLCSARNKMSAFCNRASRARVTFNTYYVDICEAGTLHVLSSS